MATAPTTILVDTVLTVDGTWTLPPGTVLKFAPGGQIKGVGLVFGGIIDAPMKQHIFATTLRVAPEGTYTPEFSVCWFGASPNNPDNSDAIQRSIDTITGDTHNALHSLYIPKGIYSYSKPLKIAIVYGGRYVGVSIKMHGEGTRTNLNTILNYTSTDGYALGVQVGKGCEFYGFAIKGRFKSPTTADDKVYYNLKWEEFTDANGLVSPTAYYGGLVIDPDGSFGTSGSTDIHIHDMYVGGFNVNYLISPNPVTYNAECIVIKRIAGGECRAIISGGQAQEKGNRIEDVMSWERIYCVFTTNRYGKTQPGHYMIDGINAANKTVSIVYNKEDQWYPIFLTNIFAESLGRIGTITTSQSPVSISNSIFHFVIPEIVGDLIRFTANTTIIKFSNCTFRYYDNWGVPRPMVFSGAMSFDNCGIWGTFTNASKCKFNGCVFWPGTTPTNAIVT